MEVGIFDLGLQMVTLTFTLQRLSWQSIVRKLESRSRNNDCGLKIEVLFGMIELSKRAFWVALSLSGLVSLSKGSFRQGIAKKGRQRHCNTMTVLRVVYVAAYTKTQVSEGYVGLNPSLSKSTEEFGDFCWLTSDCWLRTLVFFHQRTVIISKSAFPYEQKKRHGFSSATLKNHPDSRSAPGRPRDSRSTSRSGTPSPLSPAWARSAWTRKRERPAPSGTSSARSPPSTRSTRSGRSAVSGRWTGACWSSSGRRRGSSSRGGRPGSSPWRSRSRRSRRGRRPPGWSLARRAWWRPTASGWRPGGTCTAGTCCGGTWRLQHGRVKGGGGRPGGGALTEGHDADRRDYVVVDERPRLRVVRPVTPHEIRPTGRAGPRATYTLAFIVPIRRKIVYRMNTLQTRLRKEIFASLAMSRYRQRGMQTKRVAIRTTIVRLVPKSSGTMSRSLRITLVAVSPTTTLYETIAAKNGNRSKGGEPRVLGRNSSQASILWPRSF